MYFNIWAILVATLVPLVIGFIWYNPKVFGNAWMKATGMTMEQAESANMPKLLGLCFLFAFLVSFVLNGVVIHQNGFLSLLGMDPDFGKAGTQLNNYVENFKSTYGNLHRSFGHGAIHGGVFGLLTALPMIGTHAMYEQKSFKYIAINAGYWIVCSIIMGGIICAWV